MSSGSTPVYEIDIRPERLEDHTAVRRTVAAAFGSEQEADLVEAIRASSGYRPELALVATVDGNVAGHVMISAATLRTADGDREIVMLSPLAVAPEHHGRGIGSSLVDAAVAAADEQGEPIVVLEGSPRFYGRLGFDDARRHGITLPLPDWAPPEAGQVRRLRSYGPAFKGAVVYPPPFDALGPAK